jgi:hypothetical protein
MPLIVFVFALLPPALAFALSFLPPNTGGEGRVVLSPGGRRVLLAAVGAVAPAFLWLLAAHPHVAVPVACMLSLTAAAYAAWIALGWAGVLGAGLLAVGAASGIGWAVNVLSVAAGVGAAVMLARQLPARTLALVLAGFACFDAALVASGLVGGAVGALPALGVLSPAGLVDNPPVFNRVVIDGHLLGAGDVWFGASLGLLLGASGAGVGERAWVCATYAAGAVLLFAAAAAAEAAVPATIPGSAAVGAWLMARRRAKNHAKVA